MTDIGQRTTVRYEAKLQRKPHVPPKKCRCPEQNEDKLEQGQEPEPEPEQRQWAEEQAMQSVRDGASDKMSSANYCSDDPIQILSSL